MQNQYFIGIDVAKRQNVATISDFKSIKETFSFDNNLKGFHNLAERISAFKKVTLGVEATGVYHLPLCHKVASLKYPIKVINPLLTKKMAKATIRKTKTDKIDSGHLATMIKNGEGYIFDESKTITKLKVLTRHYLFLQNMAQQIIAHNDTISFRETIFENQNHKENQDQEQLISARQMTENILKVIRANQKKLISEGIKIGKEIEEVKYLDSIPGISPYLALRIYSEIGDINRFKSPNSLVAFAGIDPSIQQSGDSKNFSGRISKRGSPYLRHYLFLAAPIAARYDEDLKKYYQKKKNEGKHYYIRLTAISRRLLLRIYRLLKDKRLYIRYPQKRD